MVKMGHYEMGSIRCHPNCMTSAGEMQGCDPMFLCVFVMLWDVNVYVINGVRVCHVVVLQQGPDAYDT